MGIQKRELCDFYDEITILKIDREQCQINDETHMSETPFSCLFRVFKIRRFTEKS